MTVAVHLGLVDLAVQAIDGTKVAANAAGDQTYDAVGLQALLERTEVVISELEAQNAADDTPNPPRLPKKLHSVQDLRQRVNAAIGKLAQSSGQVRVSLTDEDAQLMKGRQGILPAYNAQALVSPLGQTPGMLITAADVVDSAADYGQLVPMLEQAEEVTGPGVRSVQLGEGRSTRAWTLSGHFSLGWAQVSGK